MSKENIVTGSEEEASNLPTPMPELAHIDSMNVDVVAREIYVGDDIDENFGLWFTLTLNYLTNVSGDPITVYISSPGGDVVSMFTFHDAVRASEIPITIVATGQVCSAAVLMLACGHHRLVTESCVLMSHRGTGGMYGDIEQLEARMKYQKWCEEHWAKLMDRYTPDEVDGRKRDYNYWFQLGKKQSEWWLFGGEEIVKEGIADAIFPTR